MLNHPTLDQLHALGLYGMAKAFAEIAACGEADGLGHHEWLGLLLDREASWRQDKRLAARLRVRQTAPAGLRRRRRLSQPARPRPRPVPEARRRRMDQRPRQSGAGRSDRSRQELARLGARPQGLPRQPIGPLSARSPAVRGPRAGARRRSPSAPAAQRSAAPICSFSTIGVWSPSTPPPGMISWKSSKSAMAAAPRSITSQLPVDRWHEIIGDPTYADAILDRLVHNAHRIELTGESMRRTRGKPNQKGLTRSPRR